MTWKNALLGFLLLLAFASTLVAVWAQRGLVGMYGGHTEVVDDSPFRRPDTSVLIENINVLSPNGAEFIPRQFVLIDDGQIRSIGSSAPQAGGSQRVDGQGKYLIPGLIDAHVHLFRSANDLLLYVANGVTQIRELAGERSHLRWREAVRAGRIGPEMYIASPRTGTFGTALGWFMAWSQGFDNLKDPGDVEKTLGRYSRQGYDAVKVYSFLSKEAFQAVDRHADSTGLDMVGHVPWSVELEDIWASQLSDIAHLEEVMNALNREFGGYDADSATSFLAFVDTRSREIVSDLLENDISVTTTLWLVESFVRQKFELSQVLEEVPLEYQNPGISEWTDFVPEGLGWLPDVNRYKLPPDLTREEKARQHLYWRTYAEACRIILSNLVSGGVVLLAGTDANLPPVVPGFSLHQELESLVAAGMTPVQALRAATSVPAERMGLRSGEIAAGRPANLLLLERDPLDDIRNSRSIDSVVLRGQLFDRTTLDRLLAAVRQANDSSRKVSISAYLD